MANLRQLRNFIFNLSLGAAAAALVITFLIVVGTQTAQAQTFNVIHNFTGGGDGALPLSGLTADSAGNFYGTTYSGGIGGGANGYGTVFELAHKGSGWILTPLHNFAGGDDGSGPESKAVFGPGGSLYSTTTVAYQCNGHCTVFELTPPASACKSAICLWTETVLHRFMGGSDGDQPGYADLIFDQAGNMYGSTWFGGPGDQGTVYELMLINGSWTESVLFAFSGLDGYIPNGMTLDNVGNLYSSTYYTGTYGKGLVFELTPSESGWTQTILHEFGAPGDGGEYPASGVIFDQSGNLYGASSSNIFEMTLSNGNWIYTSLHTFTGTGPYSTIIMDAAGNLYGTAFTDGAYGYGSVFKMTYSGGSWTYTDLHDFTGGSDGGTIYSCLYLDAKGNLYGTASVGGAYGYGVVYEITP